MAKMKRRRIGKPFSLASMKEFGYIHSRLGEFKPAEAGEGWSETYRFFVSRGFNTSPTMPVGRAFLSKRLNGFGRVIIKVDNFVLNENPGVDGPLHRTLAEIVCKNDDIRSMLTYRAESIFSSPGGGQMSTITHNVDAYVEGGRLICRAGKLKTEHKLNVPLGNCWSLFDAVQSLKKESETYSFSLFEDSGIVRPSQKLDYRGDSTFETDMGPRVVHCFSRLGMGVVPVEYWLDSSGKVLAVISGSRLCVLESLIPEPLPKEMEENIKRIRND